MVCRPLALGAIAILVLAGCSSGGDTVSTTSSPPVVSATTAPTGTKPPATAPAIETSSSTEPTPTESAAADSTPAGTERPTTAPTTATASTDTAPDTSPPPTTSAPRQEPLTIDELLGLGRPIVLAHGGGEDQHPHSTPFAFAESVAAGVDMLDLDVQVTSDGVLVVHHDESVDRTTNGVGLVAEMTYDELNALDNAHWFTVECVCRDRPEAAYIFRGVRTGDTEPPPGYTAEDFVIPRFRDIVTRFPSMPLNIEIKATGERGIATAEQLAEELADMDREEHSVVTSFDDALNDAYANEGDAEITPGLGASAAWVLEETPLPDGMRILQVPPVFQGTPVLTAELIERSHEAGYVIWVWPNDRSYENPDGYRGLLEMGMDGLNINFPADGVAAVDAFTAPDADADDSIAVAAAGAQAAIDQGDDLGDCPFGPTPELVAALPVTLPLDAGFSGSVEDNGQVFSGGDVDITYCRISPDDIGGGSIEEIRIDVHPGTADLADYFAEEYGDLDDVQLASAGGLRGSLLLSGCWDSSPRLCGAFWQGPGLFIGAVLDGEVDQSRRDAVAVARALVPLVIDRLPEAT